MMGRWEWMSLRILIFRRSHHLKLRMAGCLILRMTEKWKCGKRDKHINENEAKLPINCGQNISKILRCLRSQLIGNRIRMRKGAKEKKKKRIITIIKRKRTKRFEVRRVEVGI